MSFVKMILQAYVSDNIEMIQKRSLPCIFHGMSYAEMLRFVYVCVGVCV